MNFDRFYVGQEIQKFKTGVTHMQIHYADPCWTLVVGFPGITQQELDEIQAGDLQIGFTVISGDLFFLYKLGQIPWADTPYEPRLTQEPMDYFEPDGPGLGASVIVMAVDTSTGVIKGMRMCAIGYGQTCRLHQFCREKDKQRPFTAADLAAYHSRVEETYRKHPTSEAMLRTMNPNNFFAIIQQPN